LRFYRSCSTAVREHRRWSGALRQPRFPECTQFTDLNEVMHGTGDPAAQAEQAMENVAVLSNEAGVSPSDITKVIIYVTDRAFLPTVADVVLRRLDGVQPCVSMLIVKGLARPELLMEVDVSAMKAHDRQ
jgi:enamine deaminase RidA (YjgF/YER057c/UK114 family)